MANLKINFENPWLLLILILAIGLVLFTFFRVNKRFRYSSNRIISLFLALITTISAVLLLSGMKLSYDKKNLDNEVVLLVDSSSSNIENKSRRDEYVKGALESKPENVLISVVKFAYDYVLALEPTKDINGAYDKYLASDDPISIATNIEGAIDYAYSIIKNKTVGKIILVGDAIETDGSMSKAISNVALEGVKLDIVKLNNKKAKDEIMPTEVIWPNTTILTNSNTNIDLKLMSSYKGDTSINMYDNGRKVASQYVSVKPGENIISFSYSFKELGLHEVSFSIDSGIDTLKENNEIYSYCFIEEVNKVLILQRENEGELLYNLYKDKLDIELKNISNAPTSIDALRNYDQIVLANISNADMKPGFDKLLNEYVEEFGGGLLTLGGTRLENGKTINNAYNRADMENTLYQDMLPVIAEDYTPPVGVMFVIDTSGSMNAIVDGETTRMDETKEAAKAALDILDPRDFVGITSFGDTANVDLMPTSVAQKALIEYKISTLQSEMNGTVYTYGLQKGGAAIKSLSGVNKRHIIFLSDGQPGSGDTSYIATTEQNYLSGITTSAISYRPDSGVEQMRAIADAGHGTHYVVQNLNALKDALRKELQNPLIRDYEYETFTPQPGKDSKVFDGVDLDDIPTLDGFFGARLRKEAKASIVGEYGQPIYASWGYGKGKVGSLMIDLNNEFSADFMAKASGQKIISNILLGLFPISPIKKKPIELSTEINNTTVVTNIYTKCNEDEYIRATISKLDSAGNTTAIKEFELKNFHITENIQYNLLESGIYEIKVEKLSSADNVLATEKSYVSFSYSEDFNPFLNNIDRDSELKGLLAKVNGDIIAGADEGYRNLVLSYNVSYDMRYILASITLIAFLGDVAIRKFKIKLPHEIIKERKNKER